LIAASIMMFCKVDPEQFGGGSSDSQGMHQILLKEDEMGRIRSTHRKDVKYNILVRKPEVKRPLKRT
jgi:hypothetical protein